MTSRLQSSGIAALSFTLSAAVLALALTPAVASAQDNVIEEIELTARGDRMVEQRRVPTSDLDLTSAAGMKTLNSRIRSAITAVCDDHGDGRHTIAEVRCRSQARHSSNLQVAALRSEAFALAAANGARPAATDIVVAAR